MGYLSWALWHLGHPDLAVARGRDALDHAHALGHANSLGFTLVHVGVMLHSMRRDWGAVEEFAVSLKEVTEDHRLPFWQNLGQFFTHYAPMALGRTSFDGVNVGELLASTDDLPWRPYLMGLVAQSCIDTGRPEDAMRLVAEARTIIETGGAMLVRAGTGPIDRRISPRTS